ncbi:MAG: response regulator [Deltaproteobacteria bacterium]|nr:response regulator [Deltaproteobacteria bacterium]
MAEILIVEDSQSIAMAEAYRLWTAGHNIQFASTGRQALDLAFSSKPDLIILDYKLPDTNGLEVFRELQRRVPEILVIMVTGKGSENLAVSALKEGCKDYLIKNENLLDSLVKSVEQVLKEDKLQRQVQAQELALRLANLSLEKSIKERTAELERANERLQQAQKMEALGTLAGGIAHDFNNILAALIGHMEMAMLHIPAEHPARPHLEQVYRASERATELVRRILTFSRQSEQKNRPLKIAPVVREALKLLRASLPSTIEIKPRLKEETRFILADATLIHQIIMNLATNAGHAMRDKGGILTVTLEETVLGLEESFGLSCSGLKPYLVLTVSDTGNGMTPEIMTKIFDPYFTTKKQSEGTGLGLAVVLGIVKSCDGEIKVYSEPGQGATFRVYLPQTEVKPAFKETAPVLPQRGLEKILVLDDEDVLAQTVKEMLEYLGYQVFTENDPIRAMETFRAKPYFFDLVLTDQTMPRKTGLEVAAELLKIRADLPVILCTGFSEIASEDIVMTSGVKGFLMKPFTIQQIGVKVREILGNSPPRRSTDKNDDQ